MLVERSGITKNPLETVTPRRWNLAVMTIAVVLLAAVGTIAAREEATPTKNASDSTPTPAFVTYGPEAELNESPDVRPKSVPYTIELIPNAGPRVDPSAPFVAPKAPALQPSPKAPDGPTPQPYGATNPYAPQQLLQPSLTPPREAEPETKAPIEAGAIVIDPEAEKGEAKPRPDGEQSAKSSIPDSEIAREMLKDPEIARMTQRLLETRAALQIPTANKDELKRRIAALEEMLEQAKAKLRPKIVEMKKGAYLDKLIDTLGKKYEKLRQELAAELERAPNSERVKELKQELEEAQQNLETERVRDLRKEIEAIQGRLRDADDQLLKARLDAERAKNEWLTRIRAEQQQSDGANAQQEKRRRGDPSQPFKLEPGDIVKIEVEPEDVSLLRSKAIVVEHSGSLPLGPRLGRVQVAGKTLEEAEAIVVKVLEEELREPKVQLTYGGRSVDGTTTPESPALQSLREEIEELKQTIRDMREGKLPARVVPTDVK